MFILHLENLISPLILYSSWEKTNFCSTIRVRQQKILENLKQQIFSVILVVFCQRRCQGLSLLLPHPLYHAKLLTNKLAGSCIHSLRTEALAFSFLGFDYSPTTCQRPGCHSGGGWSFPIVPSLLSWNGWSILVTGFLKPRAALPFHFW